MDWNAAIPWWIAGGLMVALELATGTFYLLMLATGTLFGALAALAGVGLNGQLMTAALFSGAFVALWHWRWRPARTHVAEQANPDVHLDVGQRVQVMQWGSAGTTHVDYRGARWAARWAGTGAPSAGLHVIKSVDGNELQLDHGSG
jgi:membrane protein implicated in regulation of membrane protease activity